VNGRDTPFEVIFANPHSPESREKQNIPPTNVGAAGGEVIQVDFQSRRRIT
jgi:hypothetical protein